MSSNNTAKRGRLFAVDPHCYWCGVETKIPHGALQEDSATLDHVWNQGSVERKTDHSVVLACYRCNGLRAQHFDGRRLLIQRWKALKAFFNPDEERKRRIEKGDKVSTATIIDVRHKLVLPQEEMKSAIEVASKLNKTKPMEWDKPKKEEKKEEEDFAFSMWVLASFVLLGFLAGAGYWEWAFFMSFVTAGVFLSRK